MDQDKDIIEIDLLAMCLAIWNKIWVVGGTAVVSAIAAFVLAAFVIPPKYESTALMYVNNTSFSLGNTSFSISSGELSAAQSLVDTYLVILKTRLTLNTVIEEAELSYTYDELVEMIDATSVNGTEIFEITVTDYSPQQAEKIANVIAQVLPEKISDIVEGSSVKIVDYAIVPAYPSSPSITKYTIIGFFIGFMVSAGIVVLLELLNTTIRNEDYLIDTYGLPILAVIPVMQTSQAKDYSNHKSYESSAKKVRGGHDVQPKNGDKTRNHKGTHFSSQSSNSSKRSN